MGSKPWRWPCPEQTLIMKKLQGSLPSLTSLRLWAKKWRSISFFYNSHHSGNYHRAFLRKSPFVISTRISQVTWRNYSRTWTVSYWYCIPRYSSFNDHSVASTEKSLSKLKFLRAQRGQIKAEFSEVLKGLADLDPTFAGMTNKIRKIQGIWLMVNVHLAHLLARLIFLIPFILLAVERFSDALIQTIRHEPHQVRSGEFLLLAAVWPPYSWEFKGIQSICDNLNTHIWNIAIQPGPIWLGRVETNLTSTLNVEVTSYRDSWSPLKLKVSSCDFLLDLKTILSLISLM